MPIFEMQLNSSLVYRILNSGMVRYLLAPTTKDKLGMGKVMASVLAYVKLAVRIADTVSRIAQRIVAERFKPDSKDQPDMLGSFVRHGLAQPEAEAESLVQMCDRYLTFPF